VVAALSIETIRPDDASKIARDAALHHNKKVHYVT
jgi:hypothetical protein